MIKNYLVIAYRNLIKNKSYSLINIGGLAVGLASALFIFLWVHHELSYDSFHKNSSRLVKVSMTWVFDQSSLPVAPTVTTVGPDLNESLAQVEKFVRLKPDRSTIVQRDEKVFRENRFYYADSSFFNVFSFRLLYGDPAVVLKQPGSVVLTRSMAKKYFGNKNPIGESIFVNNSNIYQITGIAADPPSNSHIQYDFLTSFNSLPEAGDRTWNSSDYHTYLLLRNPDQIDEMQAQVNNYLDRSFGDSSNKPKLHVVPFEDIYLHSPFAGELSPGGDILYVYIFIAIAVLILIIACINYMNLVTARAVERAKEVGMRKVVGGSRSIIAAQFLGEALIFSLLATILAVSLVQIFMPLFNDLTGKELILNFTGQPGLFWTLIGIWLSVGLLSGLYPAMVLSGFQPVEVLKRRFTSGVSGAGLRRGLVVFQFSISIFLVLCTLIISRQMEFIQQKELGYDKEHVIVLPIDEEMRRNSTVFNTLKALLGSNSHVVSVGGTNSLPVNGVASRTVRPGDKPESRQLLNVLDVDVGFLETLKLELLAGRNFDATIDPRQQFAVILNEAAVHHFGWSVEEATGQVLHSSNYAEEGKIYGVVKNFHYESLHKRIEPLVIVYYPGFARHLLVRVAPGDVSSTLSSLEATWSKVVQHRPFDYSFLDQRYNNVYQAEHKIRRIFFIFAVLAIVIACLGLFGLSSYATIQKTKEIGIRKVLGATMGNIIGLLSLDFIRLVGIGFVIAVPVGWFIMNRWLADFAYRIEVEPGIFLLTGGGMLLVALATVIWQSVRAALLNPAESLKNE